MEHHYGLHTHMDQDVGETGGRDVPDLGQPAWVWHILASRFTYILIQGCMKSIVVLRAKRSRKVLHMGPLIYVLGHSVISFVFACISSA